jgi:hypothetical protein
MRNQARACRTALRRPHSRRRQGVRADWTTGSLHAQLHPSPQSRAPTGQSRSGSAYPQIPKPTAPLCAFKRTESADQASREMTGDRHARRSSNALGPDVRHPQALSHLLSSSLCTACAITCQRNLGQNARGAGHLAHPRGGPTIMCSSLVPYTIGGIRRSRRSRGGGAWENPPGASSDNGPAMVP